MPLCLLSLSSRPQPLTRPVNLFNHQKTVPPHSSFPPSHSTLLFSLLIAFLCFLSPISTLLSPLTSEVSGCILRATTPWVCRKSARFLHPLPPLPFARYRACAILYDNTNIIGPIVYGFIG